MGVPTWVWYAVGVAAFILVVMYVRGSSQIKTTQATIPDTTATNSYNDAANATAAILGTQASELSHLGANTTPNNVPSKVG